MNFFGWVDRVSDGGGWRMLFGVFLLGVVIFSLVGVLAVGLEGLVRLGVIHDLDCPPGSRSMIYSVGNVNRMVCAVEVPHS